MPTSIAVLVLQRIDFPDQQNEARNGVIKRVERRNEGCGTRSYLHALSSLSFADLKRD